MNRTLLIDEKRGREIASLLGVSTSGTIGVLLAGKDIGRVESVTALVDALIAAGVRISPRLREQARQIAGE